MTSNPPLKERRRKEKHSGYCMVQSNGRAPVLPSEGHGPAQPREKTCRGHVRVETHFLNALHAN